MSQRLINTTKWLWYLLVIHAGSIWTPIRSVTVRTPPSNPGTVEAQAKFFQDFFSVQLSPYKIEFGHVCEDPNTWEQRYERKDYKNHRDMGKVRWGDKKGGYGEHYWDLNHAGHAGNQGNDGYDSDSDDGSYHEGDSHDSYDEPSEQAPSYGTEEYNPEKPSSYEENSRAKRAHPKVKVDRKSQKEYGEEEIKSLKQKNRELSQEAPTHNEEYSDDEAYKTKPKRQQYRKESHIEPREQRNQVVLVVTTKDDAEKEQNKHVSRQPDLPHYVPYEGGAGVRQHQQPEVAASVPRLFLEPATGHVVDRATGQAYVLQPINAKNKYN